MSVEQIMDNLETRYISRVDKLAELLREDINRRALQVGDHYMTAAQAGQMLSVSAVMANRAMNVLAERRLLVRQRRRGTFIGPAFEPDSPPTALRVVHIIKGLSRDEQMWSSVIGDCRQGLHSILPGYQVQSCILPRHNPAEMMRQILEQNKPQGTLSGIVLLSCPREVQEMVQAWVREHKLPAVSFGTVHPNITAIPSVDQDQFESGRLQAKYLLARGRRRIMLLMHDNWQPGDNLLADGTTRALADAGLCYGVLGTRCIPEDAALIKAELNRLLRSDDRPTGLICRSRLFAEAAREAAQANSIRVPDDLDIIFNANDSNISAGLGLPCTVAIYSSSKQLALVAEMLKKLIDGIPLKNDHVVLPVELLEPASAATKHANVRIRPRKSKIPANDCQATTYSVK